MKKILVLPFILSLSISCNKTQLDESIKEDKVLFYENAPDSDDNLIAEIQLKDENATTFIYGSSNSEGAPYEIKSLTYKMKNNDTIYNFILDNAKRVSITYATVFGEKLDQIIKFEYLPNDSVVTKIYKYNWATKTDSLLFQFKGKGDNQSQEYGTMFTLSDIFINDTKSLVGSFIITGFAIAALPIGVYAAGVWITGSTAWGIFGGVTTALIMAGKVAHAQEYHPTKNTEAPPSPSSGDIPNPTGTPEQPGGANDNLVNTILSGIWTLDLTLGVGSCDETLLEDESGIPPTLHFNANYTITFDSDPVGSNLNDPEFTNSWNLSQGGNLKITSNYSDGEETIIFQCNMTYDSQNNQFVGTYTNQWGDGSTCTGNIKMYK